MISHRKEEHVNRLFEGEQGAEENVWTWERGSNGRLEKFA